MKLQFITDEKGNRTGVVLSVDDFEELISRLPQQSQAKWKKRFPLRGTPIRYDDPFAEAGEWEANQ